MRGSFITTEIVESLPNLTDLHYIDTNEITGARTFDTLNRLAGIFGFTPPKERHYFEGVLYGNLRPFMPLRFLVPYRDRDGHLELVCTIMQFGELKGLVNVTSKLRPKNYEEDKDFSHVAIYVDGSSLCHLEDSGFVEFVRANLDSLFITLRQGIERVNAKKISEKEVLDYLRERPSLALSLKGLLDRELKLVKQKRPDLVQSWKHYLEFERLCEGFGS